MFHIGLDISKAKLDCLWLRDPDANKIKTKVFRNQSDGHKTLSSWLTKTLKTTPDQIQVTLEATGIYHEGIAYHLYQQGFQVCVINPARSHEFAKSLGATHKTDKKDSHILALFGHRMQPDLWQPEAPEIRELKALLRHLESLDGDLLRQLNRLEKAEVSQASGTVIESLKKLIQQLEEEKAALESDIDDHIDRHPQLKKDKGLLESIPGVGNVVARLMLSVLHSRSFKNAGQVAAYAGLVPKISESGVFKGRSRLSKQGPARLRAKLYMAAIVASQYNPDIISQKERLLSNGKCAMQALGAAMRKLVQICFGVVKHQQVYQPQHA